MSQTISGLHGDERIFRVTKALKEALIDRDSEAVPYKMDVAIGLIGHKTLLENANTMTYLANYFGYLDEPEQVKDEIMEVNLSPKEGLPTLIAVGVVKNRKMAQAQTVRDVADAIYVGDKVDEDVYSYVKMALKMSSEKFMVIATYSPHGGIPEDVYEEGARILMQHGISPVFNQARMYKPEDYDITPSYLMS